MKYSLIAISGSDRHSFLQGQLTQDLDRLPVERSLPTAWCNAKGRVIVSGRLFERDKRVILAVPAQAAEATIKRLLMYRLRADVDIQSETELLFSAFAGTPESTAPGHASTSGGSPTRHVDGVDRVQYAGSTPLLEVCGTRGAIDNADIDTSSALDSAAWSALRVALGLVDIAGDNSEKFTPHMLNLDRTGAVSFDKGCYTGQEIVARTEHLGKVKRRVHRYRVENAAANIGDKLSLDGRDLGEVVNVAGDEVLAVAPSAQHGEILDAGGGKAMPLPLPYDLD